MHALVKEGEVPEARYASAALPKLVDGAQELYFLSGGCWCYLRTPAAYKKDAGAKQPCVLYTHGSKAFVEDGGTDFTKNASSPKNPFVQAIIDAGICLVASDASGETWYVKRRPPRTEADL